MLSRKITCNSHGQDSSYFLGWQEYEKNPYHPLHNPSGIIQMGLAENQLSFDHLESWYAKNRPNEWFKQRPGGSMFRELALFQDYHGLPEFKKVLAEYTSKIRQNKVKFEANKLVLTAGATSANEALMFCLAEPGEAFLIPTPYYPGFDRDLKWRTEVEIIPINCTSSNGFRITSPALHEAYRQARNLQLKVKGIFITNPSNPLGTSLTLHELNLLISFAVRKNLHIVSDEIYAGTVFDSPRFISILEALNGTNDPTISGRVHVVSSLSKDLGLPGFRVGMIYSQNETLISAAMKMSSFGLVSSQTQHLVSKILADEEFVNEYVRVNGARLRKRREMLAEGLGRMGIRCLEGNAGLFCWVDMRHLLVEPTFEAEMELWEKMLREFGLNVSPGSSFHCSEPGWFRVCFANMEKRTLDLSVERIRALVETRLQGKKNKLEGILRSV